MTRLGKKIENQHEFDGPEFSTIEIGVRGSKKEVS
jgi:hypothetical protein